VRALQTDTFFTSDGDMCSVHSLQSV